METLLIDFVTRLPLFADWKSDNYDLILIIVNYLTKMVYYKPVKVIIDVERLAEVIIDILVWHHSLPDFIINDYGAIFTSKFLSLLYYFLGIKRWLSTIVHP